VYFISSSSVLSPYAYCTFWTDVLKMCTHWSRKGWKFRKPLSGRGP